MSGLRVCGLWAKQAPNGETFHEGSLGGMVVRIYLNSYKKTEKDPDVVVYLSQPERRGGQKPQQRSKPRITPRPQAQGNVAPQRTAYKDHTLSSDGPPTEEVPWPDESDFPF